MRIEDSRKGAKTQRLTPLTTTTLVQAAEHLAARDKTLAWIRATYGEPPMWRRATGFATLVHIILEQQVSLKSAKAMLLRLQYLCAFAPLRETYCCA